MFGMGTGGSLRLLSPETKLSLDPVAAAFLVSTLRPSNGLPTSSLGLLLAAPGFAPSKPHRPEFPSPSDQDFDFHSSHILSQTISSVSLQISLSVPFPPLSLWFVLLLPTPYSLLPTLQDQALDRLVSPSSIRYRTSTDDLSTLSSSRGLTCL